MSNNFKVIRSGKLIPNKCKKKPIIMDEEDLVSSKQSIINNLVKAIKKHKKECPDHDIRVVDQRLWSVVEMHERLS